MEVKILEEHHPVGLTMGQFLWLMKVRQIFMIGEKGDGIGGSLEVVVPMVKGMDNSEQLSIINIVVAFGRGEGLREISTRMKIPITIPLHKHSPASKKRRVCHDDKELLGVREV